MIKPLWVLGIALVWSGTALAGDQPRAPDQETAERLCEAYGPGYHLVADTGICVKIDGYVDVKVTVHGASPGDKPGK